MIFNQVGFNWEKVEEETKILSWSILRSRTKVFSYSLREWPLNLLVCWGAVNSV